MGGWDNASRTDSMMSGSFRSGTDFSLDRYGSPIQHMAEAGRIYKVVNLVSGRSKPDMRDDYVQKGIHFNPGQHIQAADAHGNFVQVNGWWVPISSGGKVYLVPVHDVHAPGSASLQPGSYPPTMSSRPV